MNRNALESPFYATEKKSRGSALLIEPDPRRMENERRALMGTSDAVHAVSLAAALYELQPPEEPLIAVISSALGAVQLSAVTEYVRHRWPRARILIVGEAYRVLEDHLYDETVSSHASEEEILIAVEKCRGAAL